MVIAKKVWKKKLVRGIWVSWCSKTAFVFKGTKKKIDQIFMAIKCRNNPAMQIQFMESHSIFCFIYFQYNMTLITWQKYVCADLLCVFYFRLWSLKEAKPFWNEVRLFLFYIRFCCCCCCSVQFLFHFMCSIPQSKWNDEIWARIRARMCNHNLILFGFYYYCGVRIKCLRFTEWNNTIKLLEVFQEDKF